MWIRLTVDRDQTIALVCVFVYTVVKVRVDSWTTISFSRTHGTWLSKG